MFDIDNWQAALANGFELRSSGTTGEPKRIFQTPAKLLAANKVAVAAQNITAQSRILTVCRMTHAGGLLAQSLPAWSVHAHVEIKPFNAFSFWRDIKGYTHTHLTPMHCKLLMQTKNFSTLDLGGAFVTCGSDNVTFDIIETFVERGAVFMCNWGMTEIGPITINTVFDTLDKVKQYREQALAGGTLLGDRYFCEYKIIDDELWVRGDVCIYKDWFNTNDLV
ncbi:MAG: class I adenylate-forming enzyme family protein, partial [Gammaproteobacteria bacterium]